MRSRYLARHVALLTDLDTSQGLQDVKLTGGIQSAKLEKLSLSSNLKVWFEMGKLGVAEVRGRCILNRLLSPYQMSIGSSNIECLGPHEFGGLAPID